MEVAGNERFCQLCSQGHHGTYRSFECHDCLNCTDMKRRDKKRRIEGWGQKKVVELTEIADVDYQ